MGWLDLEGWWGEGGKKIKGRKLGFTTSGGQHQYTVRKTVTAPGKTREEDGGTYA